MPIATAKLAEKEGFDSFPKVPENRQTDESNVTQYVAQNSALVQAEWKVLQIGEVKLGDDGEWVHGAIFECDDFDAIRALGAYLHEGMSVIPLAAHRRVMEALERQADNMAFIINHVTLPDQWRDKFMRELDEDRAALAKAPQAGEALGSQVERLANFIMAEVPGEPSQNEGAIDTAIRWMRARLSTPSREEVPTDEQVDAIEVLRTVQSMRNLQKLAPPVYDFEQAKHNEAWAKLDGQIAAALKAAGPSAQQRVSKEVITAARELVAARFSTYKARNGREIGIQDDSGEKCWIVPFDEMARLEAALSPENGGA